MEGCRRYWRVKEERWKGAGGDGRVEEGWEGGRGEGSGGGGGRVKEERWEGGGGAGIGLLYMATKLVIG